MHALGLVDLLVLPHAKDRAGDAPDDATIAKASIAIGSLGNVRIETLSAFTEDHIETWWANCPEPAGGLV